MKKTPQHMMPTNKIKEICEDLESLLNLLDKKTDVPSLSAQEASSNNNQKILLEKIKSQISELS